MIQPDISITDKKFSDKLHFLRTANNLSMDELSKLSGVSKATIHRVEICSLVITLETQEKLLSSMEYKGRIKIVHVSV
jgi:transcriptional regulator with XRE-family HTH domain